MTVCWRRPGKLQCWRWLPVWAESGQGQEPAPDWLAEAQVGAPHRDSTSVWFKSPTASGDWIVKVAPGDWVVRFGDGQLKVYHHHEFEEQYLHAAQA